MGFTNPGTVLVETPSELIMVLSWDGNTPGEIPFTRMGTSVDAKRLASVTVSWSSAALLGP